MFRWEMGSKRGSVPPKEGDLTCMPIVSVKYNVIDVLSLWRLQQSTLSGLSLTPKTWVGLGAREKLVSPVWRAASAICERVNLLNVDRH